MQHPLNKTTYLPPDPTQRTRVSLQSANGNKQVLPLMGGVNNMHGIIAAAGVALGGLGFLIHNIWQQQTNQKKVYSFQLDGHEWKETSAVRLRLLNDDLTEDPIPVVTHVFTFYKSNVTFVGYTPSVHQPWSNSARVNLMAVEDDCVLLFSMDPRDQKNYLKDGLYIFKLDATQCLLIHLDRGHFSGAFVESAQLESVQRTTSALSHQSVSTQVTIAASAPSITQSTAQASANLHAEHVGIARLSATPVAPQIKWLSLSQRKFRRSRV